MAMMTIRSKVLVRPSAGRKFFVKLLWCCVILLAVMAVGALVAGMGAGTLLSLAVPAMIVSRFTTMEKNIPHYEFALATITFEEDRMIISYQGKPEKKSKDVTIEYNNIISVEHSEPLQCFKVTFDKSIDEASNGSYHLLYMEDVSAPRFENTIEKKTGLRVTHLK